MKGDCSICFNAPESVEMALELLDGGYLRIGSQISVTKAQFQKKEGLGDEDGSSDVKRARSKIWGSPRRKLLRSLYWKECSLLMKLKVMHLWLS